MTEGTYTFYLHYKMFFLMNIGVLLVCPIDLRLFQKKSQTQTLTIIVLFLKLYSSSINI